MPSARRGSTLAPHADGAVATTSATADLFHTLAAAFAPPPADLAACEWCEPLADDFRELGAELGIDLMLPVARLEKAAKEDWPDGPWLVEYSRLFLVPPIPVPLNTGVYLEGGLGGVSAQMILQCYGTAGFAPSESFRDLPDHVSIQLEFVGSLLQRAGAGDGDAADMAREFVDSFVAHWVRPLRDALEKAAGRRRAALVYLAVMDVLQLAVDPALF